MSDTPTRPRPRKLVIILVLLAVFGSGAILGIGAGVLGGGLLGRTTRANHEMADGQSDAAHRHGDQAEPADKIWTCSMHPQVRRSTPGSCPLCGMDLIPVVEEGGGTTGARELRLSETARRLAEIEVVPVERRVVAREVRMVGKVEYDETRLATITAWVPGRLDRLFVDYTGVPVRKGDHLVSLYSPDVQTAQQELIQAIAAVERLSNSGVGIVRTTTRATVEAARAKLRLWGLTNEQIATIEARGSASDHITIYAPIGGIVVHKNAVEGMYVKTGTEIYTIADLSQVWVKLDAYESDLAWLRYAQEVVFHTEAYPGETFNGRITFIDPVLDETTRTVKIRVNVPNPRGRLKPGMFVRSVVHARMAVDGKVIDAGLAGKWVSPMHPEIVRDAPGPCDVCGMPLVRAEELGFAGQGLGPAAAPLVVPASVPLITGNRAVVYVRSPTDAARFEGRTVTLGHRAGDYYIVRDGLAEGELVVARGAFKIDSALQILAKPSMMNPQGGGSADGHAQHGSAAAVRGPSDPAGAASARPATGQPYADLPAAFTGQLTAVIDAYMQVQAALAADDHASVQKGARELVERLAAVDMELLTGEAHTSWMKLLPQLRKSAELVVSGTDVNRAREGFAALSEALAAATRAFGTDLPRNVLQLHCPMAFNNRGASWLQATPDVVNPYFGEVMLRCGEVTETLAEGGE